MYFRNYRTRKTCLDKCLKGRVSEDPRTGDMVNGPKHWCNLNESGFIIFSYHCEGNGVAKVTIRAMKIFYRFLNTLTADDKYSLIGRDNWMQTIQMHLSEKLNLFSQFFSEFFKSPLNFEYFQKNMKFIAYVFLKLPTTEDVLRSMPKGSRLRVHQDRRHGKRADALIQS